MNLFQCKMCYLCQVYDNTSGSNETVVSSRVPSIKESTFRRPLLPQTHHKIGTADAFKTQLDVRNYHIKRNIVVVYIIIKS